MQGTAPARKAPQVAKKPAAAAAAKTTTAGKRKSGLCMPQPIARAYPFRHHSAPRDVDPSHEDFRHTRDASTDDEAFMKLTKLRDML
eukprot:6491495-Amphidinium_carterae.1